MARIADEEIERLKKEISLERLVTGFGVELKRKGKDLFGRCPFHDDKTPSLSVSPETNLWHCLGACNTGGDVIAWVMKTRGVSFRHAVELLRDGHPSLFIATTAAGAGRVVRKGTTVKLASPVTADANDQQTLREVVSFYHQTLKESPEALRYLESRGLRHSEMIGHFQIGFANRKLGLTLPDKNRKAGEELRGRLQRLGILRESGHEHFNGSVVIPVTDHMGQSPGAITEMYGRKVTPNLREGTPLHLYLPGPHRGVWNEEALQVSKDIILCESLIDALTFWCAGFRNVTASYGVSGFTDDHRRAFQKHGTQRIYIAYDRDEAGDKAAATLADELMRMGIECYRVLFPKGMDANEYALKVKPADKSLGVLVNKAQWLGKGKAPGIPSPPEPVAAEPLPPEEPAAKEEIEPGIIDTKPETEPQPRPEPEPEPKPEPVPSLAAAPQSAPARPTPAGPAPARHEIDVPVEVRGEDIFLTLGDRTYRVRGLQKNMSYELLRVNILVSGTNQRGEQAFHVDTLDLYSARQRSMFTRQAAEELCIKEDALRRDLGRVLLKLEEMQDQQIRKALDPKPDGIELSPDERAAAMKLLTDPQLLGRIVEDFARCGVVGEETNKLVSYLGVVSRHLEAPLAVIVQSSSAAGKSSLMEAVLAFLPEEQRVQYSAMTGQSLFYMGEQDLKHKVLAIVEEQGAHSAAYALKLLQSEGVLTIASTGKDPATGRLVTQQYRVEGPVMIFLTTTAIHLDDELLNRCLVLSVNEDREQTQAIHRVQREAQTLEGLLKKRERDEILAVHRNAQRLLKPVHVVNPYARELTFLDSQTRTRRDHTKYLTLIRCIALLHQYQRPHKTVEHRGRTVDYIEVTLDDIAVANRLAHEVLGRSLDELPPQTRRLLLAVDSMVSGECERRKMERSDCRFSRRDVRAFTGWGDTQLKIHLHRLEEMEYLLVHRGGRGQSFVYELTFTHRANDAAHDRMPMLEGLIDVESLRKHVYDEKKSGSESQLSGSSRPPVGGMSGCAKTASESISIGVPRDTGRTIQENTYTAFKPNGHCVVTMPGVK